MDKRFKNIDDLFRSKLGEQNVPPVPERVKQNIDKAIGPKVQWKYVFSLSCLLALIGASTLLYWNLNKEQLTVATPKRIKINTVNFDKNSTAQKGYLAYHETNLNSSSLPTPNSTQYPMLRNQQVLTANTSTKSINSTSKTSISSSPAQQNVNVPSSGTVTSPLPNPKDMKSVKNERQKIDRTTRIKNDANSTNQPNHKGENDSTLSEEDKINQLNSTRTDSTSILNNSTLIAEKETEITKESAIDKANSEYNNKQEVVDTVSTKSLDNLTGISTNVSLEHPNQNRTTLEKDSTSINNFKNQLDSTAQNVTANIQADQTEKDTVITTKDITIDATEKPKYTPFMIRATTGINITNTNYQSDISTEKTLYNNATKDLLAFQANIDITYLLKNKLMLGTGIGWQKYNETYNFTHTTQTINTTSEIKVTPVFPIEHIDLLDSLIYIDSVISPDITPESYDTTIVYTNDTIVNTNQYSGTNESHYLSIPLHVGTQLKAGRFKVDLYASARFNFLVKASGGYYLKDGFTAFTDKKTSLYKEFYTDFVVGTGIHYPIFKNIYLTGTLQFRPRIGNIFKEATLNKSFYATHAGLGLSIQL